MYLPMCVCVCVCARAHTCNPALHGQKGWRKDGTYPECPVLPEHKHQALALPRTEEALTGRGEEVVGRGGSPNTHKASSSECL